MSAPFLLDICAVLWIAADEQIAAKARESIEGALESGDPIYVSPITAWEIGMLVSRGRVTMQMTPSVWFDRFMQAPGLHLADMSPNLLIASSFLPGDPPRDPADRIIAATAREHGLVLVTRDKPLVDYAEKGHLQVLTC